MISCLDKQENTKAADRQTTESGGVMGVGGCGGGRGAERVEDTDGEGVHCVLCDLNNLFCVLLSRAWPWSTVCSRPFTLPTGELTSCDGQPAPAQTPACSLVFVAAQSR